MATAVDTPATPVRWYRSIYFRIGFIFVIFVVVVLVAQGLMFTYVMGPPMPPREPFPDRSPNTIAAMVAADVASKVTQEPGADLASYLASAYGRTRQRILVFMKDGRVAGNSSQPIPPEVTRAANGALHGLDITKTPREPGERSPGPVVMAPIQINGELRGIVVLPPPRDGGGGPGGSPIRDVWRLLSLPGTVLLIVAATLAAALIFEPARRRLKALEQSAQRLGSGDLTVRAPEHGGDEIARVAATFNRMASELAIRDEALRTSDRLRRQMLADVSHELRTPLTSMRGYIETLHMANVSLDLATRERYFRIVERETLRLDRIVRDLLDLARLEHDIGGLDRRLFAVERVFDHVIQRHEHEARARQIVLRSHIADSADQVCADPDRIEQVVENLVANALRHTPDGGTIELSATANDEETTLAVTDSGAGIPAEHVPHVFDRFYKVDVARAKGAEGSGLGLSIAKAIIDRHGGRIAVDSQPGRTVFQIVLPQ